MCIRDRYRSGIYYFNDEQRQTSEQVMAHYQASLKQASSQIPDITTEVQTAPVFYYAEEYHQQYLSKNPNGYCGLGGTGVSCSF